VSRHDEEGAGLVSSMEECERSERVVQSAVLLYLAARVLWKSGGGWVDCGRGAADSSTGHHPSCRDTKNHPQGPRITHLPRKLYRPVVAREPAPPHDLTSARQARYQRTVIAILVPRTAFAIPYAL